MLLSNFQIFQVMKQLKGYKSTVQGFIFSFKEFHATLTADTHVATLTGKEAESGDNELQPMSSFADITFTYVLEAIIKPSVEHTGGRDTSNFSAICP